MADKVARIAVELIIYIIITFLIAVVVKFLGTNELTAYRSMVLWLLIVIWVESTWKAKE